MTLDSPSSYTTWSSGLLNELRPSGSVNDSASEYYWILDASAHPDLPGLFWNLAEQPEAWSLFMNTSLEGIREDGAWFMPCQPDSPLTEWVFSQLEFMPLGFMASAPKGTGNLLYKHFQRLIECRLPSGKPGQYRYYDPRILYGINTFASEDQRVPGLVRGPALALHAWETGRAVPIRMERNTPDFLLCTEAPELSQDLLDHLRRESQAHTVLNDTQGRYGDELRSKPLPEAHSQVQALQNFLSGSPYRSDVDLMFAINHSMKTGTEEWEDVFEEIVLTRFRDCPSLEEALHKAYPVWQNLRA